MAKHAAARTPGDVLEEIGAWIEHKLDTANDRVDAFIGRLEDRVIDRRQSKAE